MFLRPFAVASAAENDYTIESFTSTITLRQDGIVNVQENIAVHFAIDKHGIYRDIPFAYENDDGSKTYTEISVLGILRDGNKEQYDSYKNEGTLRVKIGDPNITIRGDHSYTITYTAKGVLRPPAGGSTHDELYWNVTGNNWDTLIKRATATVTLPSNGITQITCYQGSSGSREQCKNSKENEKTATFTTTRELPPYEGFTIVVGYTKGMVPILTVAPPEPFPYLKPKYVLEFLGIFLIGLSVIFFMWYKYGRDSWFAVPHVIDPHGKAEPLPLGAREQVVAEYTSPERLRPAEIGILIDERADTLDVTATIIDLAARGYLTITEIPKTWIFGDVDYELKKKEKDTKDLLVYEKLLLDRLFSSDTKIQLSELKRTFYDDLAEVKKQMYKDLENKQLFAENPETVRTKYLILGILLSIVGVFFFINRLTAESWHLMFLSLGIAVSGVFLLVFSRMMPRRTAYGRELLRRARGYRLFIDKAEKYQQQFFEKKNLFHEILPYAIIFGLTEKFAKTMQDLGVTPTRPYWYTGTAPFNAATFGQNVNQFSNSFSSAIASTPKSSGFSGGGASSGGFGGGGGGSW